MALREPIHPLFPYTTLFRSDHSWANFFGGQLALVYGRTFDAQLRKSDTEGEQWALYADHYLVRGDRKSTRLNSSHVRISYAVFCLKKKMRGRRALLHAVLRQ